MSALRGYFGETLAREGFGLLPTDLVLVRHGRSEGNEAQSRAKRGDMSAYQITEHVARHSSQYRLTDRGREEARAAGEWVKTNVGDKFDRYYTSEYVRAMETAALLDLPNSEWYTEVLLRERDKGKMDNTSVEEQQRKYHEELKKRERDCFYWTPPNGESLAHVLQRIDHTYNTLRRELSNKRVMWTFRARIENMMQHEFTKLYTSKDPKDLIHNGHVLWYSRRNPSTGEVGPEFNWLYSVCPYAPSLSNNAWTNIPRRTCTNEVLLSYVASVPRIINDGPLAEKHTEKASGDKDLL